MEFVRLTFLKLQQSRLFLKCLTPKKIFVLELAWSPGLFFHPYFDCTPSWPPCSQWWMPPIHTQHRRENKQKGWKGQWFCPLLNRPYSVIIGQDEFSTSWWHIGEGELVSPLPCHTRTHALIAIFKQRLLIHETKEFLLYGLHSSRNSKLVTLV